MYTLLSGLWKYWFQKEEFFVLILGLDNAGKTTYLEQTKTKFNKGYKGMNLAKLGKLIWGKLVSTFGTWADRKSCSPLWDKYYAESHAIIYVVDSSDRERIEESKAAFDKMVVNSALHGVPLLLLANKQDLEGCLSVDDVRHVFNPIAQVVGDRDCSTEGVSALRGDGVSEGISWLAERIKRNVMARPPTQRDIT